LAVACVVGTVGALEVSSALGETQTWDEGIHIVSGYTYLQRGDFSWNPEHPPLAKMMAALPLLWIHPDLPTGAGTAKHDEVQYGIDFLYRNRIPADTILFAARSMTILLSLLFLVALAWWTRSRFGPAAALLALVLAGFDPNLIAHGRYVTTDFALTAFYFFACVLWVQYLESGRSRHLVPAALVFSLAMVTKFSAVLLVPTLAALYAARWVQRPREFPVRRLAVASGILLLSLSVVVGVAYGPETLRCLSGGAGSLAGAVNRQNLVGDSLYYLGSWLHLPDHRFLSGLGALAEHNAGGHASYLMGLRSDQGWWYYFPVVFAVKSTVAALAAAALLLAAGARLAAVRSPWREVPLVWVGLVFSPLFYFVVSMTGGINIGMRHILPVYPFLYVAAAAILASLQWRRAARYAMIGLGLLQVAECASISPDYLAFFNPLAGGPGNGPRYLVDSNIDWGQDIKKLVKWLDAHGTRRCRVAYFGNAQMRYYGIDELGFPPPLDQKGWDEVDQYAVASVTPLNGVYVPLSTLAPLRLKEPIAKIGWSMYVYDLRKRR
jgi:hypothetical protein